MTTTAPLTAAEIHARTPPTRNRYVDFLRVLALLVVVVGHWLMAAVVIRDGELVIGPPHSPGWAKMITWAFQVMPIFFVVGGFANSASWRSARRRGTTYAAWLRERARRLVLPALVLVAVWIPSAALIGGFGVNAATIRDATRSIAVPMWFLAVYLVVVAAAPLMLALHERYGLAVPLALAAMALGLDVAHRGFHVRFTGSANYIPVWLAVHQIGFFWKDGTLERYRRYAGRFAVAVLVAMVGLTFFGPYPVAMVGVGNADGSNNSPPTILMILLGLFQLGMVLKAEPAVQRWLQRPRAWAGVVLAASVSMTMYLWHMSVLVITIVSLQAMDSPLLHLEPLSARWAATRPLWLLILTAGMAPVVYFLRRFERPAPAAPASMSPARAALGALLLAGGISYYAFVGMHTPGAPLGLPLAAMAATAAGYAVLALGRRHTGAAAPA